MEEAILEFEQALLAMDRKRADSAIKKAMQESEPAAFIESVMVPTLEEIGRGWETGNVSLAQVYMSGRMCEEFMDKILPPENTKPMVHAPMALAVLEDYHMLGKRLVSSVLKANRFSVADYGRVETNELAGRVEKEAIEILLISALMLPSALQVGKLVELLAERKLNVKIIVGGAPFRLDKNLFREVGADATASRASDVAHTIRQVTGENI